MKEYSNDEWSVIMIGSFPDDDGKYDHEDDWRGGWWWLEIVMTMIREEENDDD